MLSCLLDLTLNWDYLVYSCCFLTQRSHAPTFLSCVPQSTTGLKSTLCCVLEKWICFVILHPAFCQKSSSLISVSLWALKIFLWLNYLYYISTNKEFVALSVGWIGMCARFKKEWICLWRVAGLFNLCFCCSGLKILSDARQSQRWNMTQTGDENWQLVLSAKFLLSQVYFTAKCIENKSAGYLLETWSRKIIFKKKILIQGHAEWGREGERERKHRCEKHQSIFTCLLYTSLTGSNP